MASWGALGDDARNAEHAIQCALEMADTRETFRKDLADPNADFDVGIGIHSGPAVFGLIGSEQRGANNAKSGTGKVASPVAGPPQGGAPVLVFHNTTPPCSPPLSFFPPPPSQPQTRHAK